MQLPPLNLSFQKTDQTNSTAGTYGPSGTTGEASGTSGMFDSSNWNVNFGGSQTNKSDSKQSASTGAAIGDLSPLLWIAGAAIVAFMIYKVVKK